MKFRIQIFILLAVCIASIFYGLVRNGGKSIEGYKCSDGLSIQQINNIMEFINNSKDPASNKIKYLKELGYTDSMYLSILNGSESDANKLDRLRNVIEYASKMVKYDNRTIDVDSKLNECVRIKEVFNLNSCDSTTTKPTTTTTSPLKSTK